MRWRGGRESDNVEDRRGMTVSKGMMGGGIGTILLVLVALYFGVDPSIILNQMPTTGSPPSVEQSAGKPAGQDEESRFVSVVLADTEDTWREIFREGGQTYREPRLVLFSDAVQSACGFAQAAMGPFYCPLDETVYIDLVFYRDLKERFRAPGDFAQAYVIAHEVGHHVQNQLGIMQKVQEMRSRVDEVRSNDLSVRTELQADCFAGLWAHRADKARQIIESGDIDEALNAASAIGDDRIQKQTRGHVVPDSFTHGSSEQRVRWFKRGLETGDFAQCNAFNVRNP
ncbi:MAG TPA: neutral zinc metallopeptidase [Syntrophales bacterium]|nr:neutral zinc metallopeptidase [Syntrophales bacterium]HOX95561.1 neutral zinc metallopeptidase [Syntrophales bacterium]HPN25681.1 neutral zinc metallopeptidase [Syntrophales bacterium]HQM29487.1 neutral zinc metallopeptidase [Syntrophales bacterium]